MVKNKPLSEGILDDPHDILGRGNGKAKPARAPRRHHQVRAGHDAFRLPLCLQEDSYGIGGVIIGGQLAGPR